VKKPYVHVGWIEKRAKSRTVKLLTGQTRFGTILSETFRFQYSKRRQSTVHLLIIVNGI
jgi:hypothetical protein